MDTLVGLFELLDDVQIRFRFSDTCESELFSFLEFRIGDIDPDEIFIDDEILPNAFDSSPDPFHILFLDLQLQRS